MESTGRFERLFYKILKEDNIAGAGGALGTGAGFDPEAGEISSSDWYAPGDARNPTPVGKVQTRKGTTGSKNKKKKKNKGVNYLTGEENEEIPEEDAEKVDKDRMKCNSPRRTSGGSKKFVVKACKDGKEKIVRFGDPNMRIKKSNPKRRKSFRARHKCDQKKDKFSAGYWSCKKW
tara:strand:+ start:5329 stop:5856 length:528 start_codon:yes stop_codon:yes gene_type:complete